MMNRWIGWAVAVALLGVGWTKYGWTGVLLVLGGVVFWLLLHYTRMITILRKAADQPIGHVASAVMLNAKLKAGVPLMHVIAMTRSLGALQSPKDAQPELFRWTDASDSHVTCEFLNGKLVRWTLVRPPAPTGPAPSQDGPTAP